jgi:hypothetical protein
MAGIYKSLQVATIAIAGVASYYVATHWLRPAPEDAEPLVEAVTRERPAPASSPAMPASGSAADAARAATERDHTLAMPARTRVVPDSKGDAFAVLSWLPPPPPVRVVPPPPPPPPPAPVAPPLPYTFVGLIEKGAGKPQAFIAKGDALLVVSSGDLLDGNTYRVDSLSAQQIVITYLPLNTPQTLSISGTAK